ncbi:DUF1801 domain-containing protein [Dysgonomonas sp. OttesenSCG-928-M03]|nr:DUF1801 domain-containing protein [Dysgonomonas sp. OttesenSCG-928-M03]
MTDKLISLVVTKETDRFYFDLEEPTRSCLLALRDIIFKSDDNISETQKWGIPCFSYKKKMFCFLSYEQKTTQPYLLVVEGWRIDHPALEANGRKRMKHLPIDPDHDLPIQTIEEILSKALDFYRDGTIKS